MPTKSYKPPTVKERLATVSDELTRQRSRNIELRKQIASTKTSAMNWQLYRKLETDKHSLQIRVDQLEQEQQRELFDYGITARTFESAVNEMKSLVDISEAEKQKLTKEVIDARAVASRLHGKLTVLEAENIQLRIVLNKIAEPIAIKESGLLSLFGLVAYETAESAVNYLRGLARAALQWKSSV